MITDQQFYTSSITNSLAFLRLFNSFCIHLSLSFIEAYKSYAVVAKEFNQKFIDLSVEYYNFSDGKINKEILDSDILFTEYSIPTALKTEELFKTNLPLDLLKKQFEIKPIEKIPDAAEIEKITKLNERTITICENFKVFLEEIFHKQVNGELFSFSYPFMIRRKVEEVNIYITLAKRMNERITNNPKFLLEYEYRTINLYRSFAMFIRSFVDPSREDIILKSQSFVIETNHLINEYQIIGLSPENQIKISQKSEKLSERLAQFFEYIITQLLEDKAYLTVEPIFINNIYRSIKMSQYFLYKAKST